jgi:uncharacterized protein YjiS (DUF1127 family)
MSSQTKTQVTTAAAHPAPLSKRMSASFVRFAVRLILKPVRFYRTRSDMAELLALSDRELRDIGLTRYDLRAASAHPIDNDPTDALARIVQERRRWRRKLAD